MTINEVSTQFEKEEKNRRNKITQKQKLMQQNSNN